MGKEERRRVGGFGLRGVFGASDGAAAGCGSGGGGRWVLTIVFCCRCCRQQPVCLQGIHQPAFSVNVYFLCCLMISNCKKGEGFGAVFGEISRLLKTIPRTDIVTPPPSLSTGPGFFRRWGSGGDVFGLLHSGCSCCWGARSTPAELPRTPFLFHLVIGCGGDHAKKKVLFVVQAKGTPQKSLPPSSLSSRLKCNYKRGRGPQTLHPLIFGQEPEQHHIPKTKT